jgi:hypothetical protein
LTLVVQVYKWVQNSDFQRQVLAALTWLQSGRWLSSSNEQEQEQEQDQPQ